MSAAASDAEAAILALERQRRAALVDGDFDGVDKLYDPLLVYRHASTRMDDKRSFLDSLQRTRYRSIDVKHEHATVQGGTAVVSMGEKIVTRRDDVDRDHHVVALNVWSRGADGQWRLLARQATYEQARG